MSYLVGLAIVILFFIVLHYFTELDQKQKIMITVIVAAVIAGAYLYNRMSDVERQHIIKMELRYEQGKAISCDGMDINKSTFSYSVGTQTFIGREETDNYGLMFDAARCE